MFSEVAFRTLFDLATDCMLILGTDGCIKEINLVGHDRLGYTKAEMVGSHISKFILPAFSAVLGTRMAELVDKGHLTFESAQVCKDGSVLPVEISSRTINLDGQTVFFSVIRDISRRKQAELKTLASEEKWRLLFENMTTGFALHDVICNKQGKVVDYRFLEINPAYEQLTSLKANDIIGRTVLEVLPNTETYWIDIFGSVAMSGEPTVYENYSKELGRWYQVRAFSPKLGQFAVIVSDITERMLAEKALKAREESFQTLFDRASIGILIMSTSGNLLKVNDAFARMHGYTPQEMQSMNLRNLDTPEGIRMIPERMQHIMSGESLSFEVENYHKDGHIFPMGVSASLIVIDGEPMVQSFALDITDRKRAETELRIAATAFEAQESLIITDANAVILRVNKAFTYSTGYTPDEVVGQTPRMFKSGRHNADFYRKMWEEIHRTDIWQGEIWDRRKNGEIYPKWLTISAVKGEDGIVTHYVGSHIDITERKVAEEKIRQLAFHDALTRLPNRQLLLDRLQHSLVSSARSSQKGALLFIDLDNFKTLNDTLGHLMGDMLLQQAAARLTASVREGDTVARLGGDEFVVMLEGLSELTIEAAEQVEAIGDKILAALSQPYTLDTHTFRCSGSIGATVYSGDQQDEEELLKQADIAMYQAKKAGRNTLRFFDHKMQDSINARAALESELHKALEIQQFQLHYQVQVDGSRRPIGAEALIRWIHPERGMVSPAQFIPLAEESGLILPIGLWVLETACAQLKAWASAEQTRKFVLAVNISAHQFRQADFVAQVRAAVQRNELDPSLLKLELTESMLLEDIEDTIATMNALKAIGVRLSLDDFGTGYSSLQYLKRLPLNQIKIDQSFVRDIASDSNDAAIVQTIIAMAETLGLDVIAEGVESEAQHEFLDLRGCRAYQGYLFGKPVPIEQFEAALRQG